ncbi:hypothetical protein N7517_008040, partial [Penicillium concentricum]
IQKGRTKTTDERYTFQVDLHAAMSFYQAFQPLRFLLFNSLAFAQAQYLMGFHGFPILSHIPGLATETSLLATVTGVNEPIEEERTPYYDPAQFCSARLGCVLNDQYQLAMKLGNGSNSTTWLARDLNQFVLHRPPTHLEWRWLKKKYVALKTNISAHHSRENVTQSELDILKHISEANPLHKGWIFVRRPLDSFTLEHGSGRHLILVFEPLHEPLWIYRKRFVGDRNLKSDNIMIKVEDPSILSESARDEHEHTLPQKTCPDGRRIYRAPEVILGAGYSYSVDIWGLGLFEEADHLEIQEYDELNHLGHISALLGLPPKELLDKGTRTDLFSKFDRQFKGTTIPPSNFNFEDSLNHIQNEDKRMFIEFVQRMIKWNPEERNTAKELLQDPWLYADFED